MITWPAPIDHAFILCDPKREPDRAAYLTQWLTDHSISPSCYTMELYCYGDTITTEEAYRVYNPWQNRKPIEKERNFNSYNLKPGEISLDLNWAHAAQQAVRAKYGVVLMLESDVLMEPQFLEQLRSSLAKTPPDWDFLSLSGRADLRPKRAPGDTELRWFDAPSYYHTRTTDAMVFRVDMLEKIVGTFFPFAEVLDWELNYQLTLHRSRSLWLDPPIIRQGSGKEYVSLL